MPELPEAERARQTIEEALGREITAVDDADTYVCRPHAPGEIAAGLEGRTLTKTHRRGKFLWVETSGDGPDLGLHLGMAGRIVVDGDKPKKREWDRFTLEFADGGFLALRDKRRLGRAVLEPDYSHVGPDAGEIGLAELKARVGRGRLALKAKLLDQGVLAGVGNLLADEVMWQAKLSPRRPVEELEDKELRRLHSNLKRSIKHAIDEGGAHKGEIIPHRKRDGHCPRDGTPMARATIGGRTTYWCPTCQPDAL